MSSVFYAAVLLLGVFISSLSQVILKKAANKKYDSVIREYLNLPVILAYGIFVAATFMSIFAYKGIPLSYGPLLETTGYIYITIWGVVFFKEKVNPRKLIALALIVGGIIIYAIS